MSKGSKRIHKSKAPPKPAIGYQKHLALKQKVGSVFDLISEEDLHLACINFELGPNKLYIQINNKDAQPQLKTE